MRDIMGMMKQAQAMQPKMAEMQAELDTIEVEGASGGGMVTVKMTAKGAVKAVTDRPVASEPGREGDPRGSDRRRRERCPRQGRARHAGADGRASPQGLPLPPGMKLF